MKRTEGLDLVGVESGTRIRLRVKPGARRERVVGVYGGALKVEVSAPPEGGKANGAVLALLAGLLDLRAAEVELVAGTGSRDKVVRVALAPGELGERIERALSGKR